MKIRNGFVSNSSSSSFCIYGVSVEGYKLYSDAIDEDGDTDYDKLEELEETMDERLESIDLDMHRGLENYGSDSICVGMNPFTMTKKYSCNTLAEIKYIVKEKLASIGIEGEPDWMIDGGIDE